MKTMAAASILIIEGQPLLRAVMVEVLSGEGYAVHATGDGWAALAGERRPALVVLDWNVPLLGGDVMLAGLHAAYGEGLRIVLAHDEDEIVPLARAIRPAACLPKPFDREELAEVVKLALDAV